MNPIKASDIIANDGAIKEMIAEMQQLIVTYKGMQKAIQESAKNSIKTNEKLKASQSEQREEIEATAKQADELARRYKAYNDSMSDAAVQLEVLKEKQREQNRINKAKAKALRAEKESYDSLSSQYTINKIALNKMSEAYRKNTKEGQKLEKQTKEIYEKMSDLQKATGKHQLDVGKYGKALKGLREDFKKLAVTMGIAIGANELLQFTKQSLELYDIQARAEKNLQTALGGRMDILNRLKKDASELQAVTRVGDEVILSQQAYLAGLGFTEKEIKKMIRASLDLSEGANISLESSVKNLAKTYSGLTGELGESVPELRNLTKEQLQNGEAVDIIAAKYQGFAEGAATTLTGKLEQLNNIWGDLQESFGAGIADVFSIFLDVSNTLAGVAVSLGLVKEKAEGVVKITEFLAEVFRSVGSGILAGPLIGGLKVINGTLTAFYNLNDRIIRQFTNTSLGELLGYKEAEEQSVSMSQRLLEGSKAMIATATIQAEANKKIIGTTKTATTTTTKQTTQTKKAALTVGELADEITRLRSEILTTPQGDISTDLIKQLENYERQYASSIKKMRALTEGAPIEPIKPEAIEGVVEPIKEVIKELEKIDVGGYVPPDQVANIFELFGMDPDDPMTQAWMETANRVKQLFNDIMAARVNAAKVAVDAANQEVSASQRALDIEIQNRNAGYANNVDTAKKELDLAKKNQAKALDEQRKAQRAQAAIQSVEQAVSLTTASANIWKSFTPLGPIGPILAIAAIGAMWGSFLTSKIKANQLTKKKFSSGGLEILGGGSHTSGNDTALGFNVDGKAAYGEKGEAVAIIPTRQTRKYKSILPSIVNSLRKGTFEETFKKINGVSSSDAIIINAPAPSMGNMGKDIEAIREQGERKYYNDGDGRLIERYKNLTRTYVK